MNVRVDGVRVLMSCGVKKPLPQTSEVPTLRKNGEGWGTPYRGRTSSRTPAPLAAKTRTQEVKIPTPSTALRARLCRKERDKDGAPANRPNFNSLHRVLRLRAFRAVAVPSADARLRGKSRRMRRLAWFLLRGRGRDGDEWRCF